MKSLSITKSKFSPGHRLWQFQKSIKSLILNFTTMKKSILIIILAIVAGITQSYGQACDPSPFSPAAGVPYDYSVTIQAPYSQGAGYFTWYVTSSADLLNPGGVLPNNVLIIATGDGAYNIPNAGADNITIEWTPEAIAAGGPYYLVILYYGDHPSAGCTAQNIRAWQIDPLNTFLLAIDHLAGVDEYCAPDVTGATVSGGSVQMTYANSRIYAQVTASRYTGEWRPSFRINGLDAAQSITAAAWGTAPGTYNQPCTIAGNIATSDSYAPATYDGTTIYVEILIANGAFHQLADLTINFAVDGVIELDGGGTLDDVVSVTDCSPEVPFGKSVNQILRGRPIIIEDAGTFLPIAP